jgi:hypothetical protein
MLKRKICRVCEKEKDLSEFNKKSSNKDGYNKRCKECGILYLKEYHEKLSARNNINIPEYKTCGGCGEKKASKEFSKNRVKKDGLCNYCKVCDGKKAQRLQKNNRKRNSGNIIIKKKLCPICNVEKTREEFTISLSRKDGLYAYCKECNHKVVKKYSDYYKSRTDIKYPEKKRCCGCREIKPYTEFYYNKTFSDGLAGYCKKCNYKRSVKFRLDNPEKYQEQVFQSNKRRRERVLAVSEKYTLKDRKITLSVFGDRCFRCGCVDRIHIDHFRPLIKGNALSITNAIPLCHSCNSSKGIKDPEDFFTEEQIVEIFRLFKMAKELKCQK